MKRVRDVVESIVDIVICAVFSCCNVERGCLSFGWKLGKIVA